MIAKQHQRKIAKSLKVIAALAVFMAAYAEADTATQSCEDFGERGKDIAFARSMGISRDEMLDGARDAQDANLIVLIYGSDWPLESSYRIARSVCIHQLLAEKPE